MIDVPPSASPTVARAITTARQLIAGATSENTRRAYETGWRQFTAHAQALGLEPVGAHPALVATFLGHLRDGGASSQTLGSRAATIRFFQRAAGLASPTDQRVVRDLLEGARREDAGRDHGRATITAKRLAAALELQGPHSKPGSPSASKKKGALFVAFSPYGELRETRIEGRLVAEVVKRLFRDAGAAPSEIDAMGAHSLRRGFVTSADMAGATTAQIMDVPGHRDPKSLRRYTRRELLHDPVLPKLFGN